jgi:undecaprenyl diphosphate synthase
MNEHAETTGAASIVCLGVIMDGNRRWARARDLQGFKGHAEGYKKLQEVMRWAREEGIPHVVAYAFSAENWQRSAEEVGYMLALFRSVLENETQKMVDERVRVRFIGDRTRFDKDVQKMMEKVEAETAKAYDITLHLLMSYGGRAEIVAGGRGEATPGGERNHNKFCPGADPHRSGRRDN